MNLADRTGLEPVASALTGQRSNQLNYRSLLHPFGWGMRARTSDLMIQSHPLYQLSYAPTILICQRTWYAHQDLNPESSGP